MLEGYIVEFFGVNCFAKPAWFVCAAAVIACGVLPAGCGTQLENSAAIAHAAKPPTNRVVAVSYPLQYLTERIGGDAIEVVFPVPAGTDPQAWRPTRDAISQMQTADMVVANGTGASYANWLTTVTLPESKIRNTASRGLSLSQYIAVEDTQVVHSHGPEGEHSHSVMIARTWLDPAIAKKQANYIARELKKTYPERSSDFEKNLESLVAELDQLAGLMKAITLKAITPNGSVVVRTTTPQLKFFTRAAGLDDRHLLWFEDPTIEQADKELTAASADGEKPGLILFAGSAPTAELSELLHSKGLRPVTVDLIDHRPEAGDYLSALKQNIEILQAAIEGN